MERLAINEIKYYKILHTVYTFRKLIYPKPDSGLRLRMLLEILEYPSEQISELLDLRNWVSFAQDKVDVDILDSFEGKFNCFFPSNVYYPPTIRVSSTAVDGLYRFTVDNFKIGKDVFNDLPASAGDAMTLLLLEKANKNIYQNPLNELLVHGLSPQEYQQANTSVIVQKVKNNIFQVQVYHNDIGNPYRTSISESLWRRLGEIDGYIPFGRLSDVL